MVLRGKIWTIPNVLSLFRLLLLIPILILLSQEERWWALGVMLIGAITDCLDGYIARRWNQSSDLGRILDPFIDKVTVLTVILYMIIHPAYAFPLWFFIFLAGRELVLLLCGMWVVRRQTVVMESQRAGKNSALANALVVVLFVLDAQPFAGIALWVGFALTLYSSFIYFKSFLKQARDTR